MACGESVKIMVYSMVCLLGGWVRGSIPAGLGGVPYGCWLVQQEGRGLPSTYDVDISWMTKLYGYVGRQTCREIVPAMNGLLRT
ncbi:hypothetical protein BDY19DRAFT_962312 [Irpex rosettiformis]|uniref:Uncharacterized protein n=1 Tax=Irpex rosettiformis TaxID=378272 RepID=A0ACB8TWC1_9APHY|nr:hypothetical protein BDY19DRAFT_962312 [Irpex rosettiformis]